MDIVIILRELWRLRVPVAAVALIAIAAGGLTAYNVGFPPETRQHAIGVATARALVDTPSSQVADLGAAQEGTDPVSLPARAALLANLLTTSPLREEIAKEARVPPERFIAVADTPSDLPRKNVPLATGAKVSPNDPSANVVTLRTTNDLPLITANAQAPDAKTAARIADSAIVVLERHLASKASDENVPAARQLVVEKLGAAGAATQQRGPSRLLATLVAIVLFVVGCATVVLIAALARDWRRAAALERALSEPGFAPEPGEEDEEFAFHDDDDDDDDRDRTRRSGRGVAA